MRSTVVCFALAFQVFGTFCPGRAWSAPPVTRFTKLAPLLKDANDLAKLWQEDAKLCEVRVEADADGTITMARLQTATRETGLQVAAFFHSAQAAKQVGLLLDGETGKWLKGAEEDTPPFEGVPVLLPSAMDWDEVIRIVGKRTFGVYPNDPDNMTVGIQRGYWDQALDAACSTWTIQAVRGMSREDTEWSSSMVVLGVPDVAASRSQAVSDRSGVGIVDRSRGGTAPLVYHRNPLGLLPSEASGPLQLGVTMDAAHWYYIANAKVQDGFNVAKDKAGARVVIDGVASRAYTLVGKIVNVGPNIAYKARRFGRWSVVHNGLDTSIGSPEEEGDVGWRYVSDPWLSATTSGWACAYVEPRNDGPLGWRLEDKLYINGRVQDLSLIRAPGPGVSPDRQRQIMLFTGITAFDFSPDGQRWAMIYQGLQHDTLYIDGKPLEQTFVDVQPRSLRFTPDGEDVLFVTFDGTQSTLWRNGAAVGRCSGEALITLVSNDGSRVALLVMGEDTETIHVLGGPQPIDLGPAEMITGIAFSPDSKHCAAVVSSGDESTMIVDGVAVRTSYSVTNPAFLPDGRAAYSFAAEGERASIVVGDAVTPTSYTGIPRVDVTPRGKIAYVGINSTEPAERRSALVIDGEVKLVAGTITNIKYLADVDEAICEASASFDASPVVHFKNVPVPEAPLLHRLGEKLYLGGGVWFVVEPTDSVHYMSFDKSKAVRTRLMRTDQLPFLPQ